nr:beta-2 adrenergic receptor-like [Lytechinus pictus]
MESILRDDTYDQVRSNNLLSAKQFGFVSGRSTMLQLLNVLDDWTNMLEVGGAVDVIYLEFMKAFDKVPHQRLLAKIEGFGISKLISFVWQSMWILTLASVDRYIAVTRPLQYHSLMSRKKMVYSLVTVMILALLNSGGSYLQSALTGVCHPYGNECVSIMKPDFIVYSFIPFTALVVTTSVNVRLVLISRRHARQIAALEATVNAGNIALPPPSGAGLKGLKTVLVITIVFYIAWIPKTVLNFLSPIPGIHVPPVLIIFWRYAIISNSWWNAVVYWIMNKSYRNVLIGLVRRQFAFERSNEVFVTEYNQNETD